MTERENSRQAEVMRREEKKTILQGTDQNLEGLNLGLMFKKNTTEARRKRCLKKMDRKCYNFQQQIEASEMLCFY